MKVPTEFEGVFRDIELTERVIGNALQTSNESLAPSASRPPEGSP